MSKLFFGQFKSLMQVGISALALQGCSQIFNVDILPSPAQFEVVSAPTTSGQLIASSLSRLSNLELGKQPIGSKSKYTVYLRNKGDLPGVVKSFAVMPAEIAENFTVTTDCEVLKGGNSDVCPFQVSFAPVLLGEVSAALVVDYDNGEGQLQKVNLPLQGTANNLAFLKFDPDFVDLKTDTVGYSVTGTLKVLYNGAHAKGIVSGIKPAMGVVISDPSNTQFTVDPSGTTCGSQINADCVIKLKFSAASVGLQTATLGLSYFNGSESLKIGASIQGTGLAAVVLGSLSGSSSTSFGNVVFNPAAPKTLSIPVTFNGSVPVTDVKITGPTNTAFTLSTNPTLSTCYAATMINGNCTFSVSFNPTQRKAYTDQISISYSSNNQPQSGLTLGLSGNGVNPALLTVNPISAIDFGSVPAYQPQSKSFTLTNAGEGAVSALSALTLSNTTDFNSAFNGNCGTLAGGSSCSLAVNFKPLSATSLSSNIGFTYFDGRVTQTVALKATGTGTEPAVLIGGGTIDFGNVMIGKALNSYSSISTTLGFFGATKISTNAQIAPSPLTLSSPFEFVGGSFPGTGGTCKAVMDPALKNDCNFLVKLTTTTSGLVADTVALQNFVVNYAGDGKLGTGSLNYAVKMTPRVPPVLSFISPTADFGVIAAKDAFSRSFTIKNASPYFSAAYSSATITGDSAFTITSNSCSGGIAANSSCSIVVNFVPSAAQAYSATLNFGYNDQISVQKISTPLSGTGSADVRVAVSGSSTVDFGSVFLGDTVAPKTVTLKVYGLNNWVPSFTVNAPYSLDASACGSAADCNLTVSFNPTVAGTFNVNVPVTYSPAVNPAANSFTLTLKGIAQSRSASFSASPLAFKKTLINTSFDQVITIQNNGSGVAQAPAVSISAGAFSLMNDGSFSPACAPSTALATGQSCKIKVRFAPTVVGTSNAVLSVNYTNASLNTAATFNAALSGTGTAPIQIFAGAFQTCIINELQQALCWGSNTYGQSGLGNTSPLSKTPQQIGKINLGAQSLVRKLAVGAHHVCAIVNTPAREGLVTCWGENALGRLGLGSASPALLSQPNLDATGYPVAVNLGTDPSTGSAYEVTDISAGFEHTCAILKDGKVKCWGGNSSGQLGLGNSSNVGAAPSEMGASLAAVDLKGIPAISISAGAGHTCAALMDGSAKCWGDNFYGQLGTGTGVSSIGAATGEMAALKAISLGAGAQAQSVHASAGAYSCVVQNSGALKCFGKTVYNENTPSAFFGVLGTCWARANYNSSAIHCYSNPGLNPSTSYGYFATDMGDGLVPVQFGSNSVSQFAAGDHFGCALLSDKSIRCWGANERGQLGNGGTAHVGAGQNDMGAALASTLSTSGGVSPIAVAAGSEHACAVLSNNTVKCWGASTENATSLKLYGVNGDVTTPATAPVVYDGNL